jgi:hypothetical protein
MTEVHLNGGVNLATPEEVFRAVAGTVGDRVEKIPDGETGERYMWIGWLIPKFMAVPQLEATDVVNEGGRPGKLFTIKPGFTGDDLELPVLGYASHARESYAIFRRLREQGVIAPAVRFQVSLPTVTAGVNPFIAADSIKEFRPVYERRFRSEVDEILDAIPHEDLAIQWDVAVEMGMLERALSIDETQTFDLIVTGLAELSGWIPDDVPLGYHLCYGDQPTPDSGGVGKHWKEPEDMTKLVAVANAVTNRSTRVVNWFSMPVPINRDDDAYFEPLRDLRLADNATLYLGLVHHQDGVEGTQRRIDTAKRHYASFGIATECGMARRPREVIQPLLDVHAGVEV